MKRFIWLLFFGVAVAAQPGLDTGEKLFREGKYAQAKVQFESVLKTAPSNLRALEYLGDINGLTRQWQPALSYYNKLRSLRPQNATYHYKYGGVLGMIAKDSNKFRALSLIGDIRGSFEKAITLDADHIEARWALIELYLQLPAIVGGSELKANQYAEQLLRISPVDGHLAKGHIAEYFKRYVTAEKDYQKAIAVGHSKITYEKLANLYNNKLNQPEKAKALMANYNKKQLGTS